MAWCCRRPTTTDVATKEASAMPPEADLSMTLYDWLDLVRSTDWIIFAKYLSANDTQATGAHGAGPYIPKKVIFEGIPDLERPGAENPDVFLRARIDSHGSQPERELRAIWYNQKTRDEARITRWGGASSPLLDVENTGALCIVAFRPRRVPDSVNLRVWLCADPAEEDLALDWFVDPLEPGGWVMQIGDRRLSHDVRGACRFVESDFPAEWGSSFPKGSEIVAFVADELGVGDSESVDERLVSRRDCEFAVFSHLEKREFLPEVLEGFEDLDAFLNLAHRVTNTRKVRAGRSLELQVKRILEEEGVGFTHGATTRAGKRPDFLFPSISAYDDLSYPPERLAMLGCKTTCKDRWRQVLNEADRIPTKHLFTLQEGVSVAQYREMENAGVRLVVPTANVSKFPESVRGRLMTLDGFIRFVRTL